LVAVGAWYEDFASVSDEEVRHLLEQVRDGFRGAATPREQRPRLRELG
jgi:predicted phosphoribosyltransferase